MTVKSNFCGGQQPAAFLSGRGCSLTMIGNYAMVGVLSVGDITMIEFICNLNMNLNLSVNANCEHSYGLTLLWSFVR